MPTVCLTRTVTNPDGEPVEMELEAEVSADGEIFRLVQVIDRSSDDTGGGRLVGTTYGPVPLWAMRQLDMRDLEGSAKFRNRDDLWRKGVDEKLEHLRNGIEMCMEDLEQLMADLNALKAKLEQFVEK